MGMRTDIVGGVKLITKDDMVVHAARERGGFEPDSLALWRGLSEPGRVMVDVGAYTGVYSIAAALRGATVIAFEPSTPAAKRCIENARLNGVTIDLRRAAAWSEGTSLALSGRNGMPLSSARTVAYGDRRAIQRVKAVALDKEISQPVAAIKIDAERAEPQVIAGALGIIKASLPVLLIEELDGEIGNEVAQLLTPLGYRRTQLSQAMTVWRT